MIKITGETPKFQRIETGWYSFDRALADQTEIGYPLGQILELYGSSGVGKSTVAHSLAGVLARETKSNIAIADFEGINQKLMVANLEMQGFDGEVRRITDTKDEKILQDLLDYIKKKDYSVGIIDAIGSISPVSEQEGDLGDANMGRRALLMGQFSRRANHILLNSYEKNFIIINHQHPRIGGLGMTQPGGKTKEYTSSMRFPIYRMRRKNQEETYPDGSYIIKGKIEKNRWGLQDREFFLFVLAGKGVHKGLTAMYDAMQLKLVDRERTISIGDRKFGYLKDLINEAQAGNEEFFQPFYDVLSKVNIVTEFEEENKEEVDE